MDTTNVSAATVQHVTKKSSDELLRKFAEVGDDDNDTAEAKKMSKRRKRSIRKDNTAAAGGRGEVSSLSCESPAHCNTTSALVERRSLLPVVTRKSVLLRQLGIGRSQLRARDIKNKSILVALEKTWRKTLEGASKVLLEKHYNRHRRLINDVV
ncbi:uncharacterized protein LOC8267068 [Ricinus communis]|uniref:Uncharacterized protein n=1 Tax=Ricinus communis TaxID=3988 RepID=B9SXI9_RICCO|nr:uncharacterized protein LOC8267068 [Ricinus communis]EEF31662.1 conserved hypothetical protein [Ricinus communis]|eukprot:XP_002530708.1 uncharacterized protein LOC8267068 [Ricinus communis]